MTQTPKAPDHDQLVRKNARTGLTVLGIVVMMVGVSFAAVPLYDLFCRVTGFGGTTQTSAALPDRIVDRVVTVRFDANTGRNMPWDFKPEMREIQVRLGEKGITSYNAHNRLSKTTTGTALYNVTPAKAGIYFNKIQCFCFAEQALAPGESMDMPVLFYVDPAMADDPDMADVTTITLSYTFYEASSKELEDAMDGFYNGAPPAERRASR